MRNTISPQDHIPKSSCLANGKSLQKIKAYSLVQISSSIEKGLNRSSGKFLCLQAILGFPGSSAGKESTCNAGDPSSIPGSGRSPGEGIGYLLQYS